MTRKLIVTMCAVVAVAFFAASPMLAHHGSAAYEPQPSTIKGTVVEFDFINPHCQLFINAPDETGKMVKWDGEFTNPGTLHRRGWTKDMFKEGDQITMIGNRAKNGAPVIRVLKLEMADGKVITALGADDN
jgi:Cu/Ag efflux protein CusF